MYTISNMLFSLSQYLISINFKRLKKRCNYEIIEEWDNYENSKTIKYRKSFTEKVESNKYNYIYYWNNGSGYYRIEKKEK